MVTTYPTFLICEPPVYGDIFRVQGIDIRGIDARSVPVHITISVSSSRHEQCQMHENPSEWSAQTPPQAGDAWLTTPLGQYLVQLESNWFGTALSELYGKKAVQMDWGSCDLLKHSPAQQGIYVSQTQQGQVQANPAALPFANSSVDILVLPHGLDFSPRPHQVLYEAQRVLAPDGRLLLSGFNPWSLWGANRLMRAHRTKPWSANFIALKRVKDWLRVLNLQPRSSLLGGYIPPCSEPHWQHRFAFMEAAGRRWWPTAGAVYFIQAIKPVYGMHGLVQPPKRRISHRPRLLTANHNKPSSYSRAL